MKKLLLPLLLLMAGCAVKKTTMGPDFSFTGLPITSATMSDSTFLRGTYTGYAPMTILAPKYNSHPDIKFMNVVDYYLTVSDVDSAGVSKVWFDKSKVTFTSDSTFIIKTK